MLRSDYSFSTAWTQHLQDATKRKEFESLVRNSTQVLSRLKDILEDKEREMINTSTSIKDFSDPNWSHKQAFRNGKTCGLKEIHDLLQFLGK